MTATQNTRPAHYVGFVDSDSTNTVRAQMPLSTCAIFPADLDYVSGADRRDAWTWTVGKLCTVIEALNGSPVIITTERTGHTLIGVRLIGAQYSATGPRVTVEYPFTDTSTGRPMVTNFPVQSLPSGSPIIPITAPNAKWDATKRHSDVCGAATSHVQRQHPHWYGKFSAKRLDAYSVDVTFETQCTLSDSDGMHFGATRHAPGDCLTPRIASERVFIKA